MNRTEAKEYYRKLALDAGVKEEDISGILQAFDNETTGKLLLDAFVPRPQYSSDLDARQRERDAAIAEEKRIRAWQETEGKPAYEQNLRGVKLLEKYQSIYGPLDEESTPQDKRDAARASGLSMKEVEELLDKKLREQGQLYVGLTKTAVKISHDYVKRFNEQLDVDALEKFAIDKGMPLDMAYNEYIRPKVEAASTAAWEAKLKTAREEGARDYASKHKMPADSGPKEPHPIFDHKQLDEKEKLGEDHASRDAFLEGWNKAAEEVADSNR